MKIGEAHSEEGEADDAVKMTVEATQDVGNKSVIETSDPMGNDFFALNVNDCENESLNSVAPGHVRECMNGCGTVDLGALPLCCSVYHCSVVSCQSRCRCYGCDSDCGWTPSPAFSSSVGKTGETTHSMYRHL